MVEPGLTPPIGEEAREITDLSEVSSAKNRTLEIIRLHRQNLVEQLNIDDITTPEMLEEKVLKPLVKFGKLIKAREELKKFYEKAVVQQQGYLPSDFAMPMVRLFISLEMFDEATDLLNNLREGFVSLIAGTGLPFIVSSFLKMGKSSMAKEAFFEYKNMLDQYSQLDVENKDRICLSAASDIVGVSGQLGLDQDVIEKYSDLSHEMLQKLGSDYIKKSPSSGLRLIQNLTLGGQSEKAYEILNQFFVNDEIRQRAFFIMVKAFVVLDKIDEASNAFIKARDINLDNHFFADYIIEAEFLLAQGNSYKIESLLRRIADRYRLDYFQENNSTDLQIILAKLIDAGYVFLVKEFFSKKLGKEEFAPGNYSLATEVLGENLSPQFYFRYASYIPMERRMDVFGNSSVLSEDVETLEERSKYFVNLPESLDYEELLPFMVRMNGDLQAWNELKNHLLKQFENGKNKDKEKDVVSFLLLEYADAMFIDRFIGILELLNEKFSIRNLDYYRSICSNIENTRLINFNYKLLIFLAQQNILSESKHLLYLDDKGAKTLDKILLEPDYEVSKKTRVFLVRLFKQKTFHITSVLACINELDLDLNDELVQENLFLAIDSIGAVTPITFEIFSVSTKDEREAFVKNLSRLRSIFYKNKEITPENTGLSKENFEKLLAEYIMILYRPVDFNFRKVLRYIKDIRLYSSVRDMPSELSEIVNFGGQYWDSDSGSYKMELPLRETFYRWRRGKEFSKKSKLLITNATTKVDELRYPSQEGGELQKTDIIKAKALATLVKRKDTIQPHSEMISINFDGQKQNASLLSSLLLFFSKEGQSLFNHFGVAVKTRDPNKIKEAFLRLQEVLGYKKGDNFEPGVMIQDIWAHNVKNWLEANSGSSLVENLKKQIGSSDLEEVLQALLNHFNNAILKKILFQFNSEMKKIEIDSFGENSNKVKKLRFYPSKNIPSFFAKASAGICTAEDVSLFTRKDHFHLNAVDEETGNIVGNVQMYVIEDNGKKQLLVRGINPTVAFSSVAVDESFIKAVLRVANEIAESSEFSGVILSESLGNYHADSNRPGVSKILRSNYMKEENKIRLKEKLFITGDVIVMQAYTIWENPKKSVFRPFIRSERNLWSSLRKRLGGGRV